MDDLARALQMWRSTRHPTLVRVIAALGLARPSLGPDPTTWLAVESLGDPADVPRLLDALPTGRRTRIAERLQRLVDRGPDPRVADAVRDWLVTLRFRPGPDEAYWTLVEQVLRGWLPFDTDFGALSEEIFGRSLVSGMIATRVATWTSTAPEPTAPPDVTAQIDRWRNQLVLPPPAHPLPGRDDITEALFEAVVRDLDDDAPRAVLADYLASRGDPFGAFVQHQLARHAREPRPAEERAHLPPDERGWLDTHESRWFGRAMRVHTAGAPVRGFFDAVAVVRGFDQVEDLVDARGLRTVRQLWLPRGQLRNRRALGDVLVCDALAALERVGPIDVHDLPALRRAAARPWALAVRRDTLLHGLSSALQPLPHVRHLGLELFADEIEPLAALDMPSLELRVGTWNVQGPARRFTLVPVDVWEARLHRLLDLLPDTTVDLALHEPWSRRTALALRRDETGGWRWTGRLPRGVGIWPPLPRGLDLSLVDAFRDLPHDAIDTDVAYYFDPLGPATAARPLADLPRRPVIVDVHEAGPTPSWLATLPALPELRLLTDHPGWLRYADDRFDRVALPRGRTWVTLWRGDDRRLRYAWTTDGLADDDLEALSDALGHPVTFAAPPSSEESHAAR